MTGGPPLPLGERPAFLADLLVQLRPGAPLVFVTPSMSGSYFLPWLSQHAGELAGWVAVAPVGLQQWVESGALPADSQTKVSCAVALLCCVGGCAFRCKTAALRGS